MKSKPEKIIIGRKDKVDFPELGLYNITAKIDTGAYTSAIHCHEIKIVRKGKKRYVSFRLLDPSHSTYNGTLLKHELLALRKIKNSSGQVEERCIIKTVIVLYGKHYDMELSLTDRSRMECPVLLGRKLLRKRFIVDVGMVNLSYKYKVKGVKK